MLLKVAGHVSGLKLCKSNCSELLDSSHARSNNEDTLDGVAVKSFIVNTGESGNTYLLFFY